MTICHECGSDFSRLATHWSQTSCSHPELSEKQREVTIGLLLGDGSLNKTSKNACLHVNMINREYLEYVDEIFGDFGKGVRSAKQDGLFTWTSMRHPELQAFTSWYSTGKKVWPDDISITPTVLKHLYAGDGHWSNSGTSNYIVISMWNEVESLDKVDKLFSGSGLPEPSNYAIYDDGGIDHYCNAEWTQKDSKKLWQYMGEPLPGFEYKWPEDLR